MHKYMHTYMGVSPVTLVAWKRAGRSCFVSLFLFNQNVMLGSNACPYTTTASHNRPKFGLKKPEKLQIEATQRVPK